MSATTTQPKTLYLFIDESGNFDFSPKGTKYFILSGLITADPISKREALVKLRYKLLTEGIDQEYFHATEDLQAVRNQVYAFLASLGNSYEVRAVAARKNKTNPVLYKESYVKKKRLIERVTGMGLYRKLCECLLQYIFNGKLNHIDKIIVVLGSLYVGEKKKIILRTLKHFLKKIFPKETFPNFSFEIYSHQTCADLNCQLADYCCWAISVRAERGEERPFEVIKSQIKSVFDIFKSGSPEYYQYDK